MSEAEAIEEIAKLRIQRDGALDECVAVKRRLVRLARACRVRNCDTDWPALKPLIDEALTDGEGAT